MAEESYSKNWFTPKNILLYLVVGAVVYAAIYYLFLGNKGTSTYTGSSMDVVLSEQNDSGESGVAVLSESGGKTTVTITVNNAADEAQPAHIHTGACPAPGAVTYPLTNVVNGSSVTVLDVSLATLRSQLPLAVNVHMSPADIKTYVACGNL